jgi:hypothetical protein
MPPQEFNLTAAVTPEVDSRAVERQAEETRETFDNELSDVSPDMGFDWVSDDELTEVADETRETFKKAIVESASAV